VDCCRHCEERLERKSAFFCGLKSKDAAKQSRFDAREIASPLRGSQ
jgi:hypothetical protein